MRRAAWIVVGGAQICGRPAHTAAEISRATSRVVF